MCGRAVTLDVKYYLTTPRSESLNLLESDRYCVWLLKEKQKK